MAAMIVSGSDIKYTCISINNESYQEAIANLDSNIYGFALNDRFQPAEDLSMTCPLDWCLPIIRPYNKTLWVILKLHPGDVYTPMAYITAQDIYRVVSYDVWQCDAGLVAVVTETDED